MTKGWLRLTVAAFLVLLTGAPAFAQGSSTASISGVVVDSDGAIVPGADVVVRNVNTGESFPTVSSERGVFSLPGLITGTYSVSISLQGFKTVLLENVVVNAGVPASVRAVLEVGGLTEQVVVQANSELVQTQTATVATTLDTRQVQNLPLASRDASQFIIFLPGVTTPDTTRNSSVNGLPQSSINMTLDGVNIQDNTLKSTDGFFAIVGPRLDAVEEITVTTAAGGAEGLGGGATQIRYTTRSGTNNLHGSAFYQYRSDTLNANTWFNKRDGLAKPELLQNQPGFNLGGPIVLPGFDGRNKAWFFVNYEELRSPSDIRRIRQVFHPDAQLGTFRYNSGGGVGSVNLLDLAARNGQLATADPTIAKLFADVRAAMATDGSVLDLADPLYQQYSRNVPTESKNRYPTVRLDYQASTRHRVTWTMNSQYFGGGPDTTNNREAYYPGFPVQANQSSTRRATSGWLRSTLGSTMVNEFRVGYGGAPVIFAEEQFNPAMWNGPIANQGGFYMNFAQSMGFTQNIQNYMNVGPGGTTSSRDAYHHMYENNFSWLKGSHSINIGGNYTNYQLWNKNQQIVPELRFDVVEGDPARALFVAANFPGASTADVAAARRLYAILTGRVSEVRGAARLNESTGQYEYLGQGIQRARQRQLGLWFQDSWHMGPNFTVNYGVRYDMQFPFVAENNSYTIGDYEDVFGVSGADNLFKPGTLTGSYPEFRQLEEGERAYPMDWNNVAPSIGMAWTPSASDGLLSKLTGTRPGDFSIRAGYSRSFSRLGLNDFTNEVGSNPGVSVNAFRQLALGNLGSLPLLLSGGSSGLGPGAFPATPEFPMREVVTGDMNIFSPELRVPYADTWQAGFMRALGTNMSVEARYLGARSADSWRTNNYNEFNIIENRFLDEFKLAMANLQANNTAGGSRAGSFAYFGPGSGTAPLPIYLAYFNGVNAASAGDSSRYTSANFRDSNYLTHLARLNPDPYAAAAALSGVNSDSAGRSRAISAGLAPNFFMVNPDLLNGANIVENTNRTMYHSLALELKRRSVNGLTYTGSYVFGNGTETNFLSLRIPSPVVRNGGTVGDVTHAFKLNAVYALPFGRDQRFFSGINGVLDRIIGGWQVAGNARVQSGRLLELGNVRLVGMDRDELQKLFKLRITNEGRVFMFPQEIIDESFKAFSVSATSASGYGSLGPPNGRYIAPADSVDCIETIRGEGKCGLQSVVLSGPLYKQVDLSLVKRVDIVGRVTAEFRIDAINAFNSVNFIPVTGMTIPTNANRTNGDALAAYEVTQLVNTNQARILQLVSRVRW